MRRALALTVLLGAAYVAAQMMADIASLRIVTVAGVTMDAGTLIYPFTFTLRDLVHKVAGVRVARLLIFTAAAVNAVMALFFWIVANLEPALDVGPQLEFGELLAPVWRIVVASSIAEVGSELLDTEVYRAWGDRVGHRHQWGRVLVSNTVAIPVDSVIFAFLAFAGTMSMSAVWAIIWGNLVVKFLVSFLSVPSIYWVPDEDPLDQRLDVLEKG